MNQKITQLWDNPIIQSFRANDLSAFNTREDLLRRWNTCEEYLPMEKVECTTNYYMSELIRAVRSKIRVRMESGLEITKNYLINVLKLTEQESVQIKRVLCNSYAE